MSNSTDDLMDIYKRLTFAPSIDENIKRENANINADSSMGTMLKYGSEGSKFFVDNCILPEDIAKAHEDGSIHIHDKDFYMLTETCCQIDLLNLFKNGFFTGHGFLREPQSITTAAALACIAIQANQNEMHGGQSIPAFDYALAPYVRKTYQKEFEKALQSYAEVRDSFYYADEEHMAEKTKWNISAFKKMPDALVYAEKKASEYTEKATYQAMEALIHNLNTMASRAGAQVPFSSLNYGTDTSPEGRMLTKNLLLATQAGLGNGETAIFPVQIFKVKEGVNYNPEDPNYDLFKLAMETSAQRLYPNFEFLDAPYNLQYYKQGDPNSEVATMGCRTRVMGNVYDPERQVTMGRGNLSFTSINLPRLGIEAINDEQAFFYLLDKRLDLAIRQLLHRFKIQSARKARNYPFLMGNGIWLDSEKLGPDDTVGEVLKHGTLSVGFIGLAETLVVLIGKHHGESEEAQELGLKIVGHMRDRLDKESQERKLNFTLLATPAEGLAGRFVAIDQQRYGKIEGVTDREYYTNSFHVPVYYPILAHKKIHIEAPYHALTNAGHITYVEVDGDIAKNQKAFEKIIRHMHDEGIGYGSINHPLDRDPVCGYVGVIGDVCPRCGRREGEGVSIEKLKELAQRYGNVPFFNMEN